MIVRNRPPRKVASRPIFTTQVKVLHQPGIHHIGVVTKVGQDAALHCANWLNHCLINPTILTMVNFRNSI
ncbi:MAG: hypothetical protein HYX44_04715 [Aquabacterium sp.]|nr:hypothetical protein [Aquabacterium sp.]